MKVIIQLVETKPPGEGQILDEVHLKRKGRKKIDSDFWCRLLIMIENYGMEEGV
jgi:hypothetical protein